jgi:putative oxidoreductase
MVTGSMLLYCGYICVRATPSCDAIAPQILGLGAGVLILAGLWTPLAGVLVAIAELWILYSQTGDPSIPIVLATLGITLAMIGPGAWSIDARLFGRKHIHTPDCSRPARSACLHWASDFQCIRSRSSIRCLHLGCTRINRAPA